MVLWWGVLALCARALAAFPETLPGDVKVGTGAIVEIGLGEPVELLVSASFDGAGRGGAQYFAVSAQATLGVGRDENPVPVLTLEIVPISVDQTNARALRFFATDVGRYVEAGVRGSLAIHAVGWSWQRGAPNDADASRAARYAQVAVDVIGLRMALLAADGASRSFVGSQLATVQAETGLRWSLSRRTSLKIALGGSAGAGVGDLRGADSIDRGAVLVDGEAYARIETLFNVAFAQLALAIEADYDVQAQQTSGMARAIDGAPYVQIEVSARF